MELGNHDLGAAVQPLMVRFYDWDRARLKRPAATRTRCHWLGGRRY